MIKIRSLERISSFYPRQMEEMLTAIEGLSCEWGVEYFNNPWGAGVAFNLHVAPEKAEEVREKLKEIEFGFRYKKGIKCIK